MPPPGTVPDEDLPGTFADAVPDDFQTRFVATNDGSRVDSAGDRVFFPMPREVREFATHAELRGFLVDSFYADPVYDLNGAENGVQGLQTQIGRSWFFDPQIAQFYRVTDPVLAYLGGTRGIVRIAGIETCVDPDGVCDGGVASYLEPTATLTQPTQETDCTTDGSYCVKGTSFFNQAEWIPPFIAWARHGTNEGFTRGDPLREYSMGAPRFCREGETPFTTMELCFRLYFGGRRGPLFCADYNFCRDSLPPTHMTVRGTFTFETGTFPELDRLNLPDEFTTGESSVESAVWCLSESGLSTGSRCVPLDAVAVCGAGTVDDPNLGFRRHDTGNGPLNNSVCGI